MNWYEKEKLREKTSSTENETRVASMDKTSSVIRIRKRTSLGEIFTAYVGHVAELVKGDAPELATMAFQLRGGPDLGFRFTEYDASGSKVLYFADCSFSLAPDYIRISIKGARGSNNFSETLRLFLTAPAMNTSQRIAALIRRG
jgi:hypothetical protein